MNTTSRLYIFDLVNETSNWIDIRQIQNTSPGVSVFICWDSERTNGPVFYVNDDTGNMYRNWTGQGHSLFSLSYISDQYKFLFQLQDSSTKMNSPFTFVAFDRTQASPTLHCNVYNSVISSPPYGFAY
jgi:hypothetical protein